MPHFGLINENPGSEAIPLQRAKLHIHGGKRRIHKIDPGTF